MLMLALVGLAVAAVPLAGGRLRALAEVRFRLSTSLFGALAIQILIISVIPAGSPGLHRALHAASYVMAGVFLVANRRIPGLALIAGGGIANFIVIGANGGVMPAAPGALELAGLAASPQGFLNSAALSDPALWFLGDVFAIPASWPLANVFSVGDVCLVAGAAFGVHRLSGSRLFRAAGGRFDVRKHPAFARVWLAQAVSTMGDWIYLIAVSAMIAQTHGAAHALSSLIVAQLGPAAVVGLFGGPLVDRFDRRRLMVLADVARALAVLSLLISSPSLVHVYVVASILGVFSALFQPSLYASIPELVPTERIVSANALVAGTFHTAIMAGPLIGGIVVAARGPRPAFAINALSFLVSAVLVLGIRMPARRRGGTASSPVSSLREGWRYVATNPVIRATLLVVGTVIFAAGIKAPLEPLFVLTILRERPETLGLLAAVWGGGMLVGAAAAPWAAKRWPRERLLAVAVAAVGVAIVVSFGAHSAGPIIGLWAVAGFGNGLGNVSYESLLQERSPDGLRGRVMAVSEAIGASAFLAGAVASGAVGSVFGVRAGMLLSGVVFLGAGLLARTALRPSGAADRALERSRAARAGAVPVG